MPFFDARLIVLLSCVIIAALLHTGPVLGRSSHPYRYGGYFRRGASLESKSPEESPTDREDAGQRSSDLRPKKAVGRQQFDSNQGLNLTAVKAANNNLQNIRANHHCRKPRPRLVRVKDYYSETDKVYLPRCTELFKCDDEAGCCNNEALHCVAKHTEEVKLFFYLVPIGDHQNPIQMLVFKNDTECECREVNYQPRVKEFSETTLPAATEKEAEPETTTTITTTVSEVPETIPPAVIRPKKETAVTSRHPETQSAPEKSYASNFFPQMNKGKESLCSHIDCPEPFYAQLVTRHPPHKCICDCIDNDVHCVRVKRGLKRLAAKEARCVQSGVCLEPTCEYTGTYDTIKGKCPQKTSESAVKSHHHLRHQKHYAHERD